MQDIRATEKDKVRVGESFRAGDVVRGVVVCPLHFLCYLRFPFLMCLWFDGGFVVILFGAGRGVVAVVLSWAVVVLLCFCGCGFWRVVSGRGEKGKG